MRFDYFYANCPVCSPTRASLMTGRYPDHVGVPGVIRTYATDNWGYLDPEAILLPEKLNEVGYHTALIGKWHLGLASPNTPTERGFDFFHGWLGDMMDDYWKKRRHEINYMRHNQDSIDPEGHATDLFTQWSVDYIKEQAPKAEPFFLYLAYNAPHFPVQPPEDWLAKVKEREPQLSEKRAKLVAFIEHLDDGIGQVIQALKESGEYDNTIIIFTSDNGGLLRDEANNGPLRDGKQAVYEGGLRRTDQHRLEKRRHRSGQYHGLQSGYHGPLSYPGGSRGWQSRPLHGRTQLFAAPAGNRNERPGPTFVFCAP